MENLKQIIKEQLDDSIEPRRIVGMNHVEKQDFKNWQRHGLHPFVINDDPKYGISFEQVEYDDLKPLLQRQGSKQAIYLLTDQQVLMAQRLAEPIMQMINLERKKIETQKQLFGAILVQRFMKNDFGKMAEKDDSDEQIKTRNETVATARQLLQGLDRTMKSGAFSGNHDEASIRIALEAIQNSGINWDELPASIRDLHNKLTSKASQLIS
jgi:hypothetical protein